LAGFEVTLYGRIWVTPEGVRVGREQQFRSGGIMSLLQVKRWGFVRFHDLEGCLSVYAGHDTFTDIDKSARDNSRFIGTQPWPRYSHLKPRALIDLKVMAQITPLKVGYDSVSHPEEKSGYLNAGFPPFNGLMAALLGIAGGSWGWINFRRGDRLPYSGIAFIVGMVLWAYGLFILLPWSTRAF
jgi:hypothetical protein